MQHQKYPHLFEPLKVGSTILKNRIISAPLGSITDKSISGIGMIIRGTCGSVNDSRARFVPGPYCFATPEVTKKVTDEISLIRQRGAKAEMQLCHVGYYGLVPKGDYAIGPCDCFRDDGTPVRAMNEEMMNDIADKFASSALDGKEHGFDMILFHFSHGWLPTQFLSPFWNKRTDEYGGSFENRAKFPAMIIERVRKAVGPDYPLDMRITVDDHLPGGQDPEEVVRFIKMVEHNLDMVHISSGIERIMESNVYMTSPPFFPHKLNAQWSARVKKEVTIPVAVVGAIMTPEEGEEILAAGAADAIVIGRSIIADPFWVKKAWEDRAEDIVPCLRCLNCYSSGRPVFGRRAVNHCSVSPRYLREHRVPVALEKAPVQKTVVVVGGGPAGMKAALTADERGHRVILLEKEAVLGGQTRVADYDQYKLDLKRYRDYLIYQIKKSGIELRLNTDATPEMVRSCNPDTIIVAVGAHAEMPPILGIHSDNVISAFDSYFHLDAIGKKVVIIGGGAIGAELALTLGETGHSVTVVEISKTLNFRSNPNIRAGLQLKLDECASVTIMLDTRCEEITGRGVSVLANGEKRFIEADTVVIATGMKENRELAQRFFGIVQDTNIIGDCDQVATIQEATEAGYFMCASL